MVNYRVLNDLRVPDSSGLRPSVNNFGYTNPMRWTRY